MSEKIFGKSCRNTFCVFSGFLCEKRFTQRREGRGVCPYMRKRCTQKSQKTTEFASHVSAKVCAVCVWQFFSAGFCVFRGFCVRPPHAEPRRLCETLRLCVRRKYALVSLCQKKSHSQTDTEFTPLVYLFSVNNRLRRTPSCKVTV